MSSPQTAEAGSEYRRDIDGLRAIAVICVIINHLNHAFLPGGYLGVDVFFVISGFVITSSLERTSYTSLGAQLSHFYARRIKRLMPALLTMAFATSALIRLFDPDPSVSTLTGLASIFGSSNFFLFSEATNYFGQGALRNAFSHTWSLGVEEQFYVLYPLLFRWRRPAGATTLWDDRFRIGALAALSVASLLLFVGVYGTNQPAAYFLTPFRFWELGLGCLLGLVSGVAAGVARVNAWIPVVVMLPTLVLAERYPVACTAVVVVATAFLIQAIQQGSGLYRLLSSRPATYVGAISYSLYLWHWPVICLSVWTIGIHLWSLPFQAALMLVLAAASYRWIENPLRRAAWKGGRRGTIAIGLSLMVATAGLVLLGQRYGVPKFSGVRAAEATAEAAVPGYVAPYSGRKVSGCFAEDVFEVKASDTGVRMDEAKLAAAAGNLSRCTAETNSGVKLTFVGDSHATDLFPMADRIYRDGVASVLNLSQPGCMVPPTPNQWEVCGYADWTIRLLGQDRAGSRILVIRNNYAPRSVNGELRDYSRRLEALLARTAAAGIKVVFFAPAPKYYNVGPTTLCSRQWYRPEWAMSPECRNGFTEDRGEELARGSDFNKYLAGLSQTRNDFFVFDPFAVLCGTLDKVCTPMRDGRLIYRDNSHLTAAGSELLAAPFEAFLRAHGLVGGR